MREGEGREEMVHEVSSELLHVSISIPAQHLNVSTAEDMREKKEIIDQKTDTNITNKLIHGVFQMTVHTCCLLHEHVWSASLCL